MARYPAAVTVMALDTAVVLPAVDVRVTAQVMALPLSAVTVVYVADVAPLIATPARRH